MWRYRLCLSVYITKNDDTDIHERVGVLEHNMQYIRLFDVKPKWNINYGTPRTMHTVHILLWFAVLNTDWFCLDGLVQDCNISSVLAMAIL